VETANALPPVVFQTEPLFSDSPLPRANIYLMRAHEDQFARNVGLEVPNRIDQPLE
jgi:hypothetical protein